MGFISLSLLPLALLLHPAFAATNSSSSANTHAHEVRSLRFDASNSALPKLTPKPMKPTPKPVKPIHLPKLTPKPMKPTPKPAKLIHLPKLTPKPMKPIHLPKLTLKPVKPTPKPVTPTPQPVQPVQPTPAPVQPNQTAPVAPACVLPADFDFCKEGVVCGTGGPFNCECVERESGGTACVDTSSGVCGIRKCITDDDCTGNQVCVASSFKCDFCRDGIPEYECFEPCPTP